MMAGFQFEVDSPRKPITLLNLAMLVGGIVFCNWFEHILHAGLSLEITECLQIIAVFTAKVSPSHTKIKLTKRVINGIGTLNRTYNQEAHPKSLAFSLVFKASSSSLSLL